MQAACAAVGLLASFVAWLAGSGFWWLLMQEGFSTGQTVVVDGGTVLV
jgi:hypothetical protein